MDDGGQPIITTLVLILLFVIIFVLEGFRHSINLLNDKDIEAKALENKSNRRYKYLSEIIERSTIYVNTIQFVCTLNYLLIGYILIPIWSAFFEELFVSKEKIFTYLAVIISVGLILYLVVTFTYLVPKKLAKKFPDKWAYIFIKFVHLLKTVFYPLTGIIAFTANSILFILGQRNNETQVDVTEEEIISMVNEGHEQGVLEANEAEMITNIFEYGDKKASDIMTNRSNVVAIDCHMLFKDALALMLDENNSRYPVYEENLDHITGVLYLKDAMRFHTLDETLNKEICKIEGLIRDAEFVPETKNINDLFKSMQSKKNQMVIVMDEYGQTAGLVTMEDILEEIVGNIMDEYDDEETHIEKTGVDEYTIEGMTKLEDLEERFGIDFGDCEFETLNGYLISKLDRIPAEDESSEIVDRGYCFKILSVEKNVIQAVQVTKLPEDDTSEIIEQA